jgi:hypothetical protein
VCDRSNVAGAGFEPIRMVMRSKWWPSMSFRW